MSLMSLMLIGINYNQTRLFTREKFSFSKEESGLFVAGLISQGIAKGVVVLSTCLRFEIYAENTDAAILRDYLLGFKNSGPEFSPYFYIKQNKEAALHLFTVAAGLDSQVIGENEILHQIKQAYFTAGALEATTPLLNRLFQRALFVGKAVRSETGISSIDPSIALSAVELAESLLGPIKDKRIGIIGAGTIAQKIAQHCASRQARCILVANRTFLKAKGIAESVQGEAVKFDEFYDLIDSIDILFSATASKHLILSKEIFDSKYSSGRGLVIIDLAFPRDIDPKIGDRKDVKLFNLDNFKQVNYAKAKQLLLAAELVKEKAVNFGEKERLDADDFASWQPAEFISQRAG